MGGEKCSEVIAVDITPIVAELLARNRGPDPLSPDDRKPPNYGVAATLQGSSVEMILTFRSGAAYCCMEWGCHLRLIDGKRWHGLREALTAHGFSAPPRLKLRLECLIEEGAVFFDLSKPDPARRRWYAFAPVSAHRYLASASEADDYS